MIYDYPLYYEVALSFRDISAESRFLHSCIERFSPIPVKSVFEVACGPAPHAGDLAQFGYKYVGLDINRNMLDYAQYQWRNLCPSPRLIEADMVQFELPDKVDFAFVLLGSLYLNSVDEMNRHFDCMAQALRPGALYFLDWCVQYGDPLAHAFDNAYRIEKDGIVVESAFSIRLVDETERMYEEVWTLEVNDHGRHRRFNMIERNKAILPEDFERFIAARPDFEIVDRFADWEIDRQIEPGAEARRPVILVKRK